LFKIKGFIEPKGSRWVFFGIGETLINAHSYVTRADRRVEVWVQGMGGWVDG
jgi:hypothetical protein